MGRHTPPLDERGKREYIEKHLSNELHWLLRAATEWHIQDQLRLEIDGYHVQVYAMDSACLHARALFEFFVNRTTDNYYGYDQFLGGDPLESDSYGNWKGPLHGFLMHAQDRSSPVPLKTLEGDKDLNQMPVDFAREVLRLWEGFEARLSQSGNSDDQALKQLARSKRKEAIEGAERVANSDVAQMHARQKAQTLHPILSFAG